MRTKAAKNKPASLESPLRRVLHLAMTADWPVNRKLNSSTGFQPGRHFYRLPRIVLDHFENYKPERQHVVPRRRCFATCCGFMPRTRRPLQLQRPPGSPMLPHEHRPGHFRSVPTPNQGRVLPFIRKTALKPPVVQKPWLTPSPTLWTEDHGTPQPSRSSTPRGNSGRRRRVDNW